MENQDGQQMPPTPQEQDGGGNLGPLVGVIIIIAVLVIAGFYYWGQSLNESVYSDMTPEEIVQSPDDTAAALLNQNASDDVDLIEEDVNNTDLDGLDEELGEIKNEFDSL